MADKLTVSEYVQKTAHLPFVWGVTDCLVWPSGWVWEAIGKDPAAGLRETYSTMLGAMRLVRDAGGFEALMASRLDELLTRDDTAQEGFALAIHDGAEIGGLMSAGKLLMKSDPGVGVVTAKPVAVWRL